MTPPFKLSYLSLALLLGNALNAHAGQELHHFNLPAQPLSATLNQLAQSGQTQLLYADKAVQGLIAQPVKGKYTVAQALQLALGKTDLGYEVVDNKVITVKPEKKEAAKSAGDAEPTVLETVNVVDKAKRDAKDPYNPDYTLPNATAGTKTDTPIMETPLNVQVVSKQVMKDQQVITLQESLKNVSGVVVNRDGGTDQSVNNLQGGDLGITLRGFESSTFFRNGFRLQNGSKAMANVESVEVLKGPAAILYGLVEPGGMVNVTTKQPLATPYYAFNQQFGSYDNYRTTLDATGPVAGNKDVLYRMNISYQNSGSWQDFVGKEDLFLAPVLKWNISPRTQITAEFEYNRQHQGLGGSFNPYINGQLLNFPLSRNYGEYSPAVNETFFGNLNWSHQFNDDWAIKHSFSVNQQGFTAKNFTAPNLAASSDFLELGTGFPAPITGVNVLREWERAVINQNNTYSTNLDLTGHFDTFGLKHTFLLGGDYYRLNSNSYLDRPAAPDQFTLVDPYNPVHPGLPLNNIIWDKSNTNQQTDQYGLYAQDQIKLPYDLHVTGGIRYQNIHQKTNTTFDSGTVDANGVIDSSNTSITNTTVSNDAVTPRVGILWHPQSWISLYGNYAESFGANQGLVWSASGQFKPVPPTSATQYEGGIKTEFFDGRLRATFAYYDLTKTNVAAGDPDLSHDCGLGPGSCSLAIGAIRSRGPELDIQGEILPGWNAIATWANTDIIVTKSNANGDTLTAPGIAILAVGSRMINVPRNTASVWSTYELQDTALKGLKFGGGVTIRQGQIGSGGSTLDGSVQYPAIKTPGYATLDLMTAYRRAIGKSKFTVQLNINNLLDKRYFTSINGGFNDQANQSFSAYAPYGAPRTFMGSLKIEY